MTEFLKFPYSLLAEWMCFGASVLFIKKSYPLVWKIFPFYLLVVVLIETYCYYLAWVVHSVSNQWVYNLFMPVYCLFHFYVFSKIINLKRIQKICILSAVLFIGLYTGEWFYQGVSSFFFRSFIFFNVTVISLCFIYYYSLFRQEEYEDLLKAPPFWFVTGCLIFFAISISVNTFFSELIRIKVENQFPFRFFIVGLTNMVMYGCWIKLFLCLRKNQVYIRRS